MIYTFSLTLSRPVAVPLVALVGAAVLTATGEEIANGTLLMEGGKIAAVGAALPVPPGYRTIDARGKWITPGVIDAHSHRGAWSQTETVDAHNDVNELTRSEEHTYEHQSLMRISNAVFWLKKKQH